MSGYQDCECRDCFEIVCGDGMCHGCEEAGCEPDAECQADHAYGGGEDPSEAEADEAEAVARFLSFERLGERLSTRRV